MRRWRTEGRTGPERQPRPQGGTKEAGSIGLGRPVAGSFGPQHHQTGAHGGPEGAAEMRAEGCTSTIPEGVADRDVMVDGWKTEAGQTAQCRSSQT